MIWKVDDMREFAQLCAELEDSYRDLPREIIEKEAYKIIQHRNDQRREATIQQGI